MESSIALGFSVVALLITVLSWFAISYLIIELRAMQKSTHNIQYIDPFDRDEGTIVDEEGFEELTPKEKKELSDDDDLFGDETIHTKIL